MEFGDEVAKSLSVMRKEKKRYKDYLPEEAVHAGMVMVKKTQYLWDDVREKIVNLVEQEIPWEAPHAVVWWYSILLGIQKSPSLLFHFLRFLRQHRDNFSANTQCFLYYQLSRIMFGYKEVVCEENKVELYHFYREMLETFADELQVPLEEIPLEKRDPNLVIVVTEQFIDARHGPTKTALDRCKILMKKMGKKVILINSSEMLSTEGGIPFYNTHTGNQRAGEERLQNWKSAEIPYYQCKNHMPDLEEMEELIQKIRGIAPSWIILIGGGGVLGPLLGKMVPSIAVGTVPSEIGTTCAKYQTLGRRMTEEDIRYLAQIGRSEENVIEGIFTSSLREQTEHITKEMLGISETSILMAVVGLRLDIEVTDTFLEMLEKVLQGTMCVGFFGYFKQYEEHIKNFSNVQNRSIYFGVCEDILSRMEVCDLYLNPIRKGGGTSCVEAMFKGVPVITMNYGDVALNAGEEFCVKDYQEMSEKILEYYGNKEYHAYMSKKAEERAKMLLDTETEFVKIMKEAERREQKDREGRAQDAGMEAGEGGGSKY